MLYEPGKARTYLRGIDVNLIGVGPNPFWIAYFGDFELANEWMESFLSMSGRSEEIDGTWMTFPVLQPLYSRLAFKLLMQHNRFDTYWRTHGWPDFCRPISEDDFECGMDAGP